MADTEDTETLAAELSRFRKSGVGLSPVGAKTAATAVLASSWLLARDERIRADEREKLAARVGDLIADHPMWIGDGGMPLDYLPEREARIADFCREVSARLAGEVEAQ